MVVRRRGCIETAFAKAQGSPSRRRRPDAMPGGSTTKRPDTGRNVLNPRSQASDGLRPLVLLPRPPARIVRSLARIAGEGGVHNRRGVRSGRVARGQLGRPVGSLRVELGQLV